MLTISARQRAAMDAEFFDRMALRLSAQVAQLYGFNMAGLPSGRRDAAMRDAIEQARGIGLRSNASIASFAHLCAAVGPRFHRHPEIRAHLEAHGPSLDRLFPTFPEDLDERVWEEAAEQGRADWARLKEPRS